MPERISILLLGGLEIWVNGTLWTDQISNKTPALLAYLAYTRRTHTRDGLAGIFWGEMNEADARNNLRQVLSNLKKYFEPALTISREVIGINPAYPITVDAEEYVRLAKMVSQPGGVLDHEKLAGAAALYRGDFLEGVYIREAPEFESWMLAERVRLREMLFHVLHALMTDATRQGDYAGSVDYATRLLAFDPWREETHQALMTLHARNGYLSAALAQYQACTRILKKELGVEPSAATRKLFERIQATQQFGRGNLLPMPETFVGRESELSDLAHRFSKPDTRLVTLVGPGGVGKTRLALQFANQNKAKYINGAWFISLVSLQAGSSPASIVSAIGDALQVKLPGKDNPLVEFLQLVKQWECLIVLDNLEELVNISLVITELLSDCPHIQVLATSRERLRLRLESVIQMDGLKIPPEKTEAPEAYSAVQLFIQEVQRCRPGYALSEEDLPYVQRICQVVSGYPLAIELAAAWADILDCRSIAQEIEQSLDFLATNQPDIPERQRSLRTVFNAAWNRLLPEYQQIYSQLSVFRGAFTVLSAQAVTGAAHAALAHLRDKTLIRPSGDIRFVLHELMRQFAAEKLAESGQQASTKSTHAKYFTKELVEWRAMMRTEKRAQAFEAIKSVLPDILSAWYWMAEQGSWLDLEPAVQTVYGYLTAVGRFHEAIAELTPFYNKVEISAPRDFQAFLLNRIGVMLWKIGDYETAMIRFKNAIALVADESSAQALNEKANALNQLGNVHYMVGQYIQAKEYKTAGIKVREDLADTLRLVENLGDLAAVEVALEQIDEARSHYQRAIDLARHHGYLSSLAVLLDGLGLIEQQENRFAESQRFHQEAAEMALRLGNSAGEANALQNLAEAYIGMGNLEDARLVLEALLQQVNAFGPGNHIQVYVHRSLGVIATMQSDFTVGSKHLRRALSLSQQGGSEMLQLVVLTGYIPWLAHRGDLQAALALAAFIQEHPGADRNTRKFAGRLEAGLLAAEREPLATRKTAELPTTLTGWVEAVG